MTRSARLVDDSGNTLIVLDSDTIGADVAPYVLTSLDFGTPDVRDAVTTLSGQDGTNDVTQYAGARAVTAELGILVDDGSLDTLRGLLHPGRRYWLYAQKPSWPQERRIRVRGAGLAAPDAAPPLTAQLSWKAPSPTFQDTTLSSVTLNPVGSATGGVSFPVSLPFAFDPGTVPGASILSVGGTVNALPFIDIYGPCSAPLIRVVDTGAQLSFPNLTIAQGDYLHIDVAARAVTLNDDPAQPLYQTLDFASATWPTLPTGSPEVIFSPASTGPGCVAVVSWRSSWL